MGRTATIARRTATVARSRGRGCGLRVSDCVFPDSVSDETILSPNEIGKYLGVTGEAVKQWVYKCNLKAVKQTNGYWRVRASDLRTFLSERKQFIHRILVNFNDEKVLAAITNLGHKAVVSTNYPDTVLKIIDTQPGLFILRANDQTFKLVNKIRSKQLKTVHRSPIILVGTENFDVDQAGELRCSAFIPEPIDPEQLKNEVMRLLNQ